MDPTRNSYRHFGATQNMGIPMRQNNKQFQPYATSTSEITYPLGLPTQGTINSRLTPWSQLSSDRAVMPGFEQRSELSPILGSTSQTRNVPLHLSGSSPMTKVPQKPSPSKVANPFLHFDANDVRLKEIEMLRLMKKRMEQRTPLSKSSFSGQQDTYSKNYGLDEINTKPVNPLSLPGVTDSLLDKERVQAEVDRLKEMASSIGLMSFGSSKTGQSRASSWSTSSASVHTGSITTLSNAQTGYRQLKTNDSEGASMGLLSHQSISPRSNTTGGVVSDAASLTRGAGTESYRGQLKQQSMLPPKVYSLGAGDRTDSTHLSSKEKSLEDINKRKKAIELEVEELRLKQKVRELEKERNRLLKQQQEEEKTETENVVVDVPGYKTRNAVNFSLGSFMKNMSKPDVDQFEIDEQMKIRRELEKLKSEQMEKENELKRKIEALTQKLETKGSELEERRGSGEKRVTGAITQSKVDAMKEKIEKKAIPSLIQGKAFGGSKWGDPVKVENSQGSQKRKEDFLESWERQIAPKKLKQDERQSEGEQKTISVRNLPPFLSFATLRWLFKIGTIEECKMPREGEESVYYITFSSEMDAKTIAQLSLVNKSMFSYEGRDLNISLESFKEPEQTSFKVQIDGISKPKPTMDEPLWEHFKRYGKLLTFKLVMKEEEFGKPARDAYAVAEYVDSFDFERAFGKKWQDKQVFFAQKTLSLKPCNEYGPYKSKKIAVDGIIYTPTLPLTMRKIFSAFGKILNIRSVPRLAPATSFSFVEFAMEDCVEKVMKVCKNGGEFQMDGRIVFVSKVFSETETKSSVLKMTALSDPTKLTEEEEEKMFAEKYKSKVMRFWNYSKNCASEQIFQVLLEYGDINDVRFKDIDGKENMFAEFEKYAEVDRLMKNLTSTGILASRGIAFQVALSQASQKFPNSNVIRMERFHQPSSNYILQNLFKRFGKVDHLLFKASLKADQCYGFVVFDNAALNRFWSQRKQDGTITIDRTSFIALKKNKVANENNKQEPKLSNKIRILNLPHGVTYSQLHSFMSRFGEVTGWKNQPDNCVLSFKYPRDAQTLLTKKPMELQFKGVNLILLSVQKEQEDSKPTKLQEAIHKTQVKAKLSNAAQIPIIYRPPSVHDKSKKKKVPTATLR